tara:strand:+ start:439 stop:789 length:351 start_codon:yes stop_codon:yes gene_type:complete
VEKRNHKKFVRRTAATVVKSLLRNRCAVISGRSSRRDAGNGVPILRTDAWHSIVNAAPRAAGETRSAVPALLAEQYAEKVAGETHARSVAMLIAIAPHEARLAGDYDVDEEEEVGE